MSENEKTMLETVMSALESRLWNWGCWWYLFDLKEKDPSLRRAVSISYVTLKFAPNPDKSGYWENAPDDPDEADAESLNNVILRLRKHQISEIERYYAYDYGSGTQSQTQMRYRARIKLLALIG